MDNNQIDDIQLEQQINNNNNDDNINDSENNDDDDCHLNEFEFDNDYDPSISPLDMRFVCDSFKRSIKDKSEIDLCLYLQAYNELIKFFNMFGALFTFVTKDVYSKINILESYANDTINGNNYRTISLMIEFERNENLLIDQKRPSGSRTLLRLHRALEFISIFLNEVTKLNDDDSTVNAARFAYNQTLAKYHPWYIKKSVQIATISLPYRRNLIERVYGGRYPNGGTKKVNDNISYMANITEKVFKVTQKLYEEHELLDLP